jgi:hypothetical protein
VTVDVLEQIVPEQRTLSGDAGSQGGLAVGGQHFILIAGRAVAWWARGRNDFGDLLRSVVARSLWRRLRARDGPASKREHRDEQPVMKPTAAPWSDETMRPGCSASAHPLVVSGQWIQVKFRLSTRAMAI